MGVKIAGERRKVNDIIKWKLGVVADCDFQNAKEKDWRN